MISNDLFDSSDDISIEIDFAMEDLGLIVAETLLKEWRNPMKDTHNHLSTIGGKYSLTMDAEDEKEAVIIVRANNKVSESSFDRLAECVDSNSIIGSINARR